MPGTGAWILPGHCIRKLLEHTTSCVSARSRLWNLVGQGDQRKLIKHRGREERISKGKPSHAIYRYFLDSVSMQITRAAEGELSVLRRGSVSEPLSEGYHKPMITCNLEPAKTPGSSG